MDYTIEDVDRYLRNNMDDTDYALYSGAVEALQARVLELEDSLAPAVLSRIVTLKAERDTALAKLRGLESARPVPAAPTARTYMDGYSDGKAWALESAALAQPEPVGINGLTEAETAASMSVRGLSKPTVAQPEPVSPTDDPLQGAVDWLLLADGEYFAVATVQRTLRIGYNRAQRLSDIAKERAAAKGGAL